MPLNVPWCCLLPKAGLWHRAMECFGRLSAQSYVSTCSFLARQSSKSFLACMIVQYPPATFHEDSIVSNAFVHIPHNHFVPLSCNPFVHLPCSLPVDLPYSIFVHLACNLSVHLPCSLFVHLSCHLHACKTQGVLKVCPGPLVGTAFRAPVLPSSHL